MYKRQEIYDIPVLAKEGAVIPLSCDQGNSSDNPHMLELWVFRGNGDFTLYEDNGKTSYEEHNVKTEFEIKEDGGRVSFKINSPCGETELIPDDRKYKIVFKDIVSSDVSAPENATVTQGDNGEVIVECPHSKEDIEIIIKDIKPLKKKTYQEKVIDIFSRWQCSTMKKDAAFKPFKNKTEKEDIIAAMRTSHLPKEIKALINENLAEI